jgi:hypothetical protein
VTYPPQGGGYPPQQGNYGPQQGGYGPPQGGYPQQGGYGPPPGYPPQQPGWGPPGYPPPRKNNTGLIVGVGGAVLAAVIALVLVLALNGGNDNKPSDTAGSANSGGNPSVEIPGPNGPGATNSGGNDNGGSGGGSGGGASSPEALADEVVTIIENHDSSAIDQYACSESNASGLKTELDKLAGLDITATVENVTDDGSTGQATIQMKASTGQSEGFTLEMAQNGGSWCATGI